jgi:hypothetical protein
MEPAKRRAIYSHVLSSLLSQYPKWSVACPEAVSRDCPKGVAKRLSEREPRPTLADRTIAVLRHKNTCREAAADGERRSPQAGKGRGRSAMVNAKARYSSSRNGIN